MAYADLLSEEGIKSQYLCVLSPRRQVTGTWANPSGTLYTIGFDYGQITKLTLDGGTLTEASTSALSDGDWFYDTDTETLYFDDSSTNPNSSGYFVGTYELYLGTFDAHFNRNPLDSSSRVVYYEPLISKAPAILQSVSDSLFGFLPSQTSSIILSSVTQFFQRHVHDGSFNLASIKLYHWLDELVTANVKLVVDGLCGSLKYNDTVFEISIFDTNQIFDVEFRHASGVSFYAQSDFPNLDPNFQARPVRRVFGVVDGLVPTNIDYNNTAPTTSNNRTWACINPHTNLGSVSTTVLSSPTSTATRTYLTSANGFRLNDTVWIDSNAGSGSDEFVIVTAVNKTGDHYIEHASITNVASNPDVVKRSFVGSVNIVQNAVNYTALYGRDYTEYTDGSTQLAGFTFTSTMESNLGIPSTIDPSNTVYARVYGNTNQNTLGGPAFGSNSDDTGNLTNPIVIIYEILKTYLGLTESQLSTSSFTTLEASVSSQVGFSIPPQTGSNFPRFRDLLNELFQSELIKFSYDDQNTYKIEQTGPLGALDKSIEDDEILKDSFNYFYDYSDIISDVIIEYSRSEVNQRNEVGAQLSYLSVRSESTLAERLHLINKQKTFKSLHFLAADAQTLADRLRYALGDRRGMLDFLTKNRFFDTEVGDRIDVIREKIPGFEFEAGTDRTRSGSVVATSKTLNQISIELDDQKGIEDNSGSW